MRALVLGIGNILLRDEGVGVRAVQRIEEKYKIPAGVEIVDGGTSGIELLPLLHGTDHLIIIDVARTGKRPGTIVRMEGENVPAFFRHRISPHQLGLSDLLAVARMTGTLPLGVVLFGIEPASIATGLELSTEAARSLDRLAEMVATELTSLGFELTPQVRPFGDDIAPNRQNRG